MLAAKSAAPPVSLAWLVMSRCGYEEEIPVSTLGLCQRKRPRAVEDFCLRPKEAYRVIPPLRDWQAIGDFAIAPAELNGDRAIWGSYRGDTVHRISIVWVRLQVSFVVVDGK